MRAADLDIHELLHFAPEGGLITFAGERVLLLDAVALGLLRKELIETLGATAARAVLTRFGYAHGWRVAETLRKGFPWDSEDEWRAAGARLHTIQGLVRAEVTRASLSRRRPRRRRHLARLVRGGAASAASRTGGRAGVLDADGLRQWLHVVCLRQRDHRHRRSLSGQRRCGLSRRRPLKGGVGAGTRDASAVLPEGVPRFGADAADRHPQEERTTAPIPSRAATGRSRRRLPVWSARVRRCCGRSIWRGASRRSTRPC